MEVLAYIAGVVALILLLGVLYQSLGERSDRKRYPPPGKFVRLDTHRLHFQEMGEGGPTIVLESGLMSSVLTWQKLQLALAKSARVVSYDRAGMGWSDPGPEPRDAARIVTELRDLLRRAEISPPYVLVGHSFGGLTMSLFAARYRNEVCGVVLVDPVAPMEWHPPSERDLHRAEIGSNICRRAAVVSHTGLLRLIASLVQAGAKRSANRLIGAISRGAPSDSNTTESPWFWNLPARERAMAPVFWTKAKFCRAIASQLERLPESAAQVASAGPIDMPLVVFSAGNASAQRRAAHAAIAAQSPKGRHVVAERSSHWITEDQPELLMGAILEIVERARTREFPSRAVAAGMGSTDPAS
ncbi:MAG TPA: alpha/beta hydrolase [Candidatus Acidoferrales bacterium]|nr:alpha/beta hydrolase [Candidatus Acidoferrales bacterium]